MYLPQCNFLLARAIRPVEFLIPGNDYGIVVVVVVNDNNNDNDDDDDDVMLIIITATTWR